MSCSSPGNFGKSVNTVKGRSFSLATAVEPLAFDRIETFAAVKGIKAFSLAMMVESLAFDRVVALAGLDLDVEGGIMSWNVLSGYKHKIRLTRNQVTTEYSGEVKRLVETHRKC